MDKKLTEHERLLVVLSQIAHCACFASQEALHHGDSAKILYSVEKAISYAETAKRKLSKLLSNNTNN